MIVAYISPNDATLRASVTAAAGAKVTFRDPSIFEPSQADPLDHVVYVSEHARAIRLAYARIGTAQLLSVDESPLPTPGRVIGGVVLPPMPVAEERPLEFEPRLTPDAEASVLPEPDAPGMAVHSTASTEPASGAPPPAQGRSDQGRRR